MLKYVLRSEIMKRATAKKLANLQQKQYSRRNTNLKEVQTDTHATKNKIDLSQFQKETKNKIKPSSQSETLLEAESSSKLEINEREKKQTKRQHVSITYDIPLSEVKEKRNNEKGDNLVEVGECSVKTEIKEEDLTSPKKLKSFDINYTGTKLKIGSEEEIPLKIKKDEKRLVLPYDWERVLENLREMRKDRDAPVDSMGCDQCMDETADPKDMRFQALLSLMLSSQTKDQVTHAAMLRLREHGCSVDKILSVSEEALGKLIYPVGFWKSKVKYIKKTAQILKDEYNCDIPDTVEKLCKLPGVGPKMSHLCMKTAWGQITGIGVDTHVHRITNRLGWVNTKTPEGTRKALEGWLPKDLWNEVNHLLVGFGQQICQPQRPQCATCLNYDICPFGIKQLRSENKMKKCK